MPANRSRTERWRDMLDQIAARGGAIEIAIQHPAATPDQPGAAPAPDLIWRVRILHLDDHAIVVESPSIAGRALRLTSGAALTASLSVGQNRWIFVTRTRGYRVCRAPSGGETAGLVLDLPQNVERCARRNFFRASLGQINPAPVQVWPLLEPASVVAAETANRTLLLDTLAAGAPAPAAIDDSPDSILLPQVGPMFQARLLNVSGGGLGLLLGPGEAATADRYHAFWLRIDLRPQLPIPMAVSAKRVHCHLDSHGYTYAGMAFDFTFNPGHQRFVSDVMTRYVEHLQQRQPAVPVAAAG